MSNQPKIQSNTLTALRKYADFYKGIGEDNVSKAVTKQIYVLVKDEPNKIAPAIRKEIIKRAIASNCFDDVKSSKNIGELEADLIFCDEFDRMEIEKTVYLIAQKEDGIIILDNLLANNDFVLMNVLTAYTNKHLLTKTKKQNKIVPFDDNILLNQVNYFYDHYIPKAEKPKKEKVKQFQLNFEY